MTIEFPQPDDGQALRIRVRAFAVEACIATPAQLIDEFWVPPAGERADLVALGQEFWGFEIKSARDDLRRLPRQVSAFSAVFDRCVLVAASRHCSSADVLLPAWWGLLEFSDERVLTWRRKPSLNSNIDPSVLVRLLWRDEAAALVKEFGLPVNQKSRRHVMWRQLVAELTGPEMAVRVKDALLARDPAAARIPSRRFVDAQPIAPRSARDGATYLPHANTAG